ncbi:helix-turn-helix domain-containing protein, partial [Bradyrhizobium canariense]|uniref:helix-turn-helix domain-containing protein n=1 Tax=Bradyrhizobium canariense TaxID=255045 RepID=UPI001AECF8DE
MQFHFPTSDSVSKKRPYFIYENYLTFHIWHIHHGIKELRFAFYSYLNKIGDMKTPLHKCRAYEGISIAFLALESGSSGATLSRLERGISNTSGEVCYQ